MLALFSSLWEQKQRALTPVVLSSPLPVYKKVEAKDTQIFSMGSKNKYPLLSLAHKALDNTTLRFPRHP